MKMAELDEVARTDEAVAKIRKKIIATSSLINRFRQSQLDLEEKSKQYESLQRDYETINIKYKEKLEEHFAVVQKLEKQQDEVQELQKRCYKTETQNGAMESHINQLQNLVKDYETKVEGLQLEKMLNSKKDLIEPYEKKISTLEKSLKSCKEPFEKKINALEKSLRSCKKHVRDLVVFGNIAESNTKLKKSNKLLLEKYRKKIKGDNNNEILCESDSENIQSESEEVVEVPNSCCSADTGRGSSIASSDEEKSLRSPEYPGNHVLSLDALVLESNLNEILVLPKAIMKDIATSPIKFPCTSIIPSIVVTGASESCSFRTPKDPHPKSSKNKSCNTRLQIEETISDKEVAGIFSEMRIPKLISPLTISPIPSPVKCYRNLDKMSNHSRMRLPSIRKRFKTQSKVNPYKKLRQLHQATAYYLDIINRERKCRVKSIYSCIVKKRKSDVKDTIKKVRRVHNIVKVTNSPLKNNKLFDEDSDVCEKKLMEPTLERENEMFEISYTNENTTNNGAFVDSHINTENKTTKPEKELRRTRKPKATALSKLRNKLVPKSRIQREVTPPRKKGSKKNVTPIVEGSTKYENQNKDTCSEKNMEATLQENAYEKARRVMTELNSKQKNDILIRTRSQLKVVKINEESPSTRDDDKEWLIQLNNAVNSETKSKKASKKQKVKDPIDCLRSKKKVNNEVHIASGRSRILSCFSDNSDSDELEDSLDLNTFKEIIDKESNDEVIVCIPIDDGVNSDDENPNIEIVENACNEASDPLSPGSCLITMADLLEPEEPNGKNNSGDYSENNTKDVTLEFDKANDSLCQPISSQTETRLSRKRSSLSSSSIEPSICERRVTRSNVKSNILSECSPVKLVHNIDNVVEKKEEIEHKFKFDTPKRKSIRLSCKSTSLSETESGCIKSPIILIEDITKANRSENSDRLYIKGSQNKNDLETHLPINLNSLFSAKKRSPQNTRQLSAPRRSPRVINTENPLDNNFSEIKDEELPRKKIKLCQETAFIDDKVLIKDCDSNKNNIQEGSKINAMNSIDIDTQNNNKLAITISKHEVMIERVTKNTQNETVASTHKTATIQSSERRVNNKEDFTNSPASKRRIRNCKKRIESDNANYNIEVKEQATEESVTKAIKNGRVPDTQLRNYSDLDMFSETSKAEVEPEKSETVKSPTFNIDSFFGTLLQKYGRDMPRRNCKRVSENVVQIIVKRTESEMAEMSNLPPEKLLDAMNHFTTSLHTVDRRHFVTAVEQYFKEPTRKLDRLCRNTLPAPSMSKPEQIFLYVLSSLQTHWNTGNLFKELLDVIEYGLFRLNQTPDLQQVESLSHFYAVLCRYCKSRNRLRIFMLDSLYAMTFKSIVVIKQCLEVWPNVLPLAHMGSARSPLVFTLTYLLNYFRTRENSVIVNQVKFSLKKSYSYSLEEYTQTTILHKFRAWILELNERKFDRKVLGMSMLLICKRFGVEWCQKYCIDGVLLPLIQDDRSSDVAKAFSIAIIGQIMKVYPDHMKLHCEIIVNELFIVMDSDPPHIMQEAIISSLLMLRKHTRDRIHHAISFWEPKQRISPELDELLKIYIQEKPVQIWANILSRFVEKNKFPTSEGGKF